MKDFFQSIALSEHLADFISVEPWKRKSFPTLENGYALGGRQQSSDPDSQTTRLFEDPPKEVFVFRWHGEKKRP